VFANRALTTRPVPPLAQVKRRRAARHRGARPRLRPL